MNLWQPADGAEGEDFGAHGAFDDRSWRRSPQAWLSRHHGVVASAAAFAVVGAAALSRRGGGAR